MDLRRRLCSPALSPPVSTYARDLRDTTNAECEWLHRQISAIQREQINRESGDVFWLAEFCVVDHFVTEDAKPRVGMGVRYSDLPVIRPKPAVTARIADYIVRTARNRALPSATRS